MNNPSDAPAPAPRRGPPSGSSTLSERIAALQRKASGSASGGAPGSAAPTAGGASGSSSGAGSRIGLGAPPAAVRDRIARFQPRGASSDAGSSEKPLVPRSSFGAPAPAPGTGQGSLRPYPGAAPAGSAGWGEGVLRPQLTGGVGSWGERELRPNLTGLRPQMTGGAWGRSPSYSDSPRSTLGTRDAFLELDDEASASQAGGSLGRNTARLIGRSHSPSSASAAAAAALSTSPSGVVAAAPGAPAGRISPSASRPVSMRRGSSFSAAQLDAASAGLRRSESVRRSGEVERSESPSPAPRTVPLHGANGNAKEASLPDVPRAEPGGNNGLPALPSAPTSAPRAPLPLARADEMGDTSVEIEVRNLDSASVQRLQERLASVSPAPSPSRQHAQLSDNADDGSGADAIGRLALGSGNASPALTPQRMALNRALSQRSAQSVESAHGVAYRDRSPSPLPPSSSPPTAVVPTATPSTPSAAPPPPSSASARTGTGTGTSRTTPASTAPSSTASSVILGGQRGHRSQPSNESGIIDPLRDASAAADEARSEGLPASTSARSGLNGVSSSSSKPASAAAQQPQPQPQPTSPTSPTTAAAAQRARDAISLARAKSTSQKLRRPPPGMTLSAAEMDASDDEYEPGWASVISTSRTPAM